MVLVAVPLQSGRRYWLQCTSLSPTPLHSVTESDSTLVWRWQHGPTSLVEHSRLLCDQRGSRHCSRLQCAIFFSSSGELLG